MELKKQDKNGVRTATDLERRYNFNKIRTTEERVEDIEKEKEIDDKLSLSSTRAVQNKVITENINRLEEEKQPKEEGKGLSKNDFTDEDKESIHKHNNKEVLDNITQGDIEKWNSTLSFQMYKVGDLFFSTNDPNKILGYGTWEQLSSETYNGEKEYIVGTWVRTA